jgi:hypothetical protein
VGKLFGVSVVLSLFNWSLEGNINIHTKTLPDFSTIAYQLCLLSIQLKIDGSSDAQKQILKNIDEQINYSAANLQRREAF